MIGRLYFSDLMQQYDGNVTLASAAYNAGPGTIDRALQTSRAKDFWGIKTQINPETRNKAKAVEIWQRFPKFIIGFVITFILGLYLVLGTPADVAAKVPAAVGVPEMVPVDVEIDMPPGSEPELML